MNLDSFTSSSRDLSECDPLEQETEPRDLPDQTWASLIATADHDAQTLFQPLTVQRFILVLKTIIGIARSLERSMGRLATLSLPAKEVQTQPPSRASTSIDGSSNASSHPFRCA